jgi:sulfur carrier protein ThiS
MEPLLIFRDQEIPIENGISLLQALQNINLPPEIVMAIRDGRLMMEDEIIQEGDRIKLISVISGGSR